MLSRVIAKNIGDVFLRHTVYSKWHRRNTEALHRRSPWPTLVTFLMDELRQQPRVDRAYYRYQHMHVRV